jgi:hypothetical protein
VSPVYSRRHPEELSYLTASEREALDQRVPGDLSAQALQQRYALFNILAAAIGVVAVIASTYVPLMAVRPIIEAVAGKETSVDVVVSISVAMSITLSLCLAGATAMVVAQRRLIRQQRSRIVELENQASRLKARGRGRPR